MPLVVLYAAAATAPVEAELLPGWGVWLKSLALATAVSAAAVVLGYVPGRLVGTARRGRILLVLGLLLPLLLPRHLTYYAWTLLLSPTTALGKVLGADASLARFVSGAASTLVGALWYWPLAALLMGQGWRGMDADTQDEARLDAGPLARLLRVTVPLMGRPLLLAFGVCLLLAMSEFASFHLAGVDTVGTELAMLHQLTGSEAAVARAGLPLAVAAVLAGAALWKRTTDWSARAPTDRPHTPLSRPRIFIVAALLVFSLAAPAALLAGHLEGTTPLVRFWALHRHKLGWSAATAAVAGVGGVWLAAGSLAAEKLPAVGRVLAALMQITLLLAALMPGSILAVALYVTLPLADGFWLHAAALAARFAGLALVVLRLMRDQRSARLAEAAAVDGASTWRIWLHVHLPRSWPLLAGAFLLVAMLAMAELPVTTVLLPPGMPNFGHWLLNEMHYARDQHVITACLMLLAAYAVLTLAAVSLIRLPGRVRRWRAIAAAMLLGLALPLAGCDSGPATQRRGRVAACFGRTGRGPGEFVYPRAVDFDAEGDLAVVDRTGRVQRLRPDGKAILTWRMPKTDAGYPTGLTFGPDGNWYVPDTHYHRVMVYTPEGRLVRRFGEFGQGDGQFIFPTDVAFAPDGRIFVAEFGGNDRISIFSAEGRFIRAFGSCGSGEGELSRPSALAVDAGRGRLYVADGCNHRIAVYDLEGRLQRYFGSVGSAAGELRYPRDLALLADGRLLVCEFGNNRVQVFTPDGRSEALYGGPGRELGQLAYPWAVAVGRGGRAYVVDSGNNRIQIWRL